MTELLSAIIVLLVVGLALTNWYWWDHRALLRQSEWRLKLYIREELIGSQKWRDKLLRDVEDLQRRREPRLSLDPRPPTVVEHVDEVSKWNEPPACEINR